MRSNAEKFSYSAFVSATEKERALLELELGEHLPSELASCFGKGVSNDYRDTRVKQVLDWLRSLGHSLPVSRWDTINQVWRYEVESSKKGGLVVMFWWEWDDDDDEKEKVEVAWHEFEAARR